MMRIVVLLPNEVAEALFNQLEAGENMSMRAASYIEDAVNAHNAKLAMDEAMSSVPEMHWGDLVRNIEEKAS